MLGGLALDAIDRSGHCVSWYCRAVDGRMRIAGGPINLVHLSAGDCASAAKRGEISHHQRYNRAFSAYFCYSQLQHLARYGLAKGGTFMRKIILVASAVALGAATMTTGALGADLPGFVARPGLNYHFAYHHSQFSAWYDDGCWDGRRWVLGTRRGWTWQACVWPY